LGSALVYHAQTQRLVGFEDRRSGAGGGRVRRASSAGREGAQGGEPRDLPKSIPSSDHPCASCCAALVFSAAGHSAWPVEQPEILDRTAPDLYNSTVQVLSRGWPKDVEARHVQLC